MAYGIGLCMAFIAFGVTNVGQPALLYLVPCCLGMLCIVGRKELRELWDGPKVMRLADKIKNRYERAWGRERMKRQVARKRGGAGATDSQNGDRTDRRRPRNSGKKPSMSRSPTANTALTKEPSSEIMQSSRGRPRHSSGPKPPPSPRGGRSATLDKDSRSRSPRKQPRPSVEGSRQPGDKDVCFGDLGHLGTRQLRTAIKRELKNDPLVEFSPTVFKSVMGHMGGSKFFVKIEGVWTLATKNQVRNGIGRMFEMEGRKLQERNDRM